MSPVPVAAGSGGPVAVVPVAVALVALLLAGLALAAIRVLRRRLDRLSAALDALTAGGQGGSFAATIERQHADAQSVRDEVRQLGTQVEEARAGLAQALRHVAVVRYDAFADLGGRFSFSAALLDDAGDGLVVTSIHARSEARTYLKGVTAGRSEQALSPEELEAIGYARRRASTGR